MGEVSKKSVKASKGEKSAPIEARTAAGVRVIRPEGAPKPITIVSNVKKTSSKKPEEAIAFENQHKDMAFSFAEQMKRRQKEQEEQRKASTSTVTLTRRPTTRARGKATMQFSDDDLAEFRKRLIVLRQDAIGQSTTLRANALEQSDERGSEDEDGSDSFMRLQNLSQVDSQNKIVQKIDEALHRIDDGTYGICEVCGQLIRKPRLLNLPFAHTCMECQNQMEGRR